MSETTTEKQRVAVEALEAARRAGVPLSDYAKAKGLELRPVYDAIAALRRRGALPGSERRAQVMAPRAKIVQSVDLFGACPPVHPCAHARGPTIPLRVTRATPVLWCRRTPREQRTTDALGVSPWSTVAF
jgi:hypothetical protein